MEFLGKTTQSKPNSTLNHRFGFFLRRGYPDLIKQEHGLSDFSIISLSAEGYNRYTVKRKDIYQHVETVSEVFQFTFWKEGILWEVSHVGKKLSTKADHPLIIVWHQRGRHG